MCVVNPSRLRARMELEGSDLTPRVMTTDHDGTPDQSDLLEPDAPLSDGTFVARASDPWRRIRSKVLLVSYICLWYCISVRRRRRTPIAVCFSRWQASLHRCGRSH